MTGPRVVVDAHCHLHPRFDAGAFLDAAAANARADAVLCLTEAAGVDRFAELRAAPAAGCWALAPTDEPESLHARADAATVTLLAGRQIITAERIEVLALATPALIDDALSLDATLDAVLAAGAIPVLPWGFGKWWGLRGRLVQRALGARTGIFVGDQAGRPRGAPAPRALRLARQRGIPVLPGSDPLDLPSHLARPASYAFVLDRPLDTAAPAADFRARVRALTGSPPTIGRRVSILACARDQAALRLRRGGPT